MPTLSTAAALLLSLTVSVGTLADVPRILKQFTKIRPLSECTLHTLFEQRLFQIVAKSILVPAPCHGRPWPKAYFRAPKHLVAPVPRAPSAKTAASHQYHA